MSGMTKYLVARAMWRTASWSVRVSARYVSGRPLNGKIYTDSSRHFLRRGTRACTPDGVASTWAMLPGWQRAALRVGVPGTLASTAYVHSVAPLATDIGVTGAAIAGTVVGGRRAVRRVRRRQITRTYVQPLATALGPHLGQPADRPDRWLHVPEALAADLRPGVLDKIALPSWVRTPVPVARVMQRAHKLSGRRKQLVRGKDEGWIRIPLSMLSTPDVRALVGLALSDKIDDDLVIQWHTKGTDPHVKFFARPRPPKLVMWNDVKELLAAAPDSAPILGLTATGPFSIDLDTDAPHIAISCGSGAWKSILLRVAISQWLHKGVQVYILDGKQTSQRWCKDIPGVTYCRTGEQMHEALLLLRAEAERRATIVNSIPADSEEIPNVGPRIVAVFEEQNIGMQMIFEYWRSVKEKGDPNRPPSASALDYLLCAGREFKMHVVTIAQLLTVQATGGNPAARINYGIRILSRADRNAWVMLAPECAPFPKQTKRRGRMHAAISGELVEFQSILSSVSEAREWAMSGDAVTVPVTWTPVPDQRDGSKIVTHKVYTLAEAARQEWCDLKYDALRQAKRRAGDKFPPGREVDGVTKWTAAEIKGFLAARSEESEGVS